ncbi:hypothetical protein ACUYOF_14095 [Photobacterium ganghwense]|uniref:hypothetical protein n=1 Tax=Photobacterium ganghwense TaxID=320778 RepID=UPI004057B49A
MEHNLDQQMNDMLSGLNTNSSDIVDFLSQMYIEFETFKKVVIGNNVKYEYQVAQNKIAEVHAALNGESDKFKRVEVERDLRTAEDFLQYYAKKHLKSVREFFMPVRDELYDNNKLAVVYHKLSDSRAKKKLDNAINAFAYQPNEEYYLDKEYHPPVAVSPFNLLVLFDTTVFGSAKTGICLTDQFIVYKGVGKIPHEMFYYTNIDSIKVDTDENSLNISGKSTKDKAWYSFSYDCYKVTPKLNKAVGCINDFINQPAYRILKHLINRGNPDQIIESGPLNSVLSKAFL